MLRALIAGPPALNRFALSKAFCRRIGWYKPDGGLKDMMARVTMLAMHKDGLIVLPLPKWLLRNPAVLIFGPDTDAPLEPPPETLDEVRPVRPANRARGHAPKPAVERVYRPLSPTTSATQPWSAHRCATSVHDRHGRLLSLLGFSTAARKLAPRDRLHRLDADTALRPESPQGHRQRPFPHPALDTHPQPRLAHPVRRVPTVDRGLDRALSHHAPVDRRGDAALHWRHLQGLGWTHVGITQGRGRYDRHKKYDKPKKTIWLRPLRKDWKRTLNR